MKRVISLALVLLMAFMVIFASCNVPDNETPLSFSVRVVHLNGTEKTFEYSSTKAMLGDALLQEGLIDGYESQYGLTVTTVDGTYYDWEGGTYWAFYIDGEYAMTGVDLTPITEGAVYTFKAETY